MMDELKEAEMTEEKQEREDTLRLVLGGEGREVNIRRM